MFTRRAPDERSGPNVRDGALLMRGLHAVIRMGRISWRVLVSYRVEESLGCSDEMLDNDVEHNIVAAYSTVNSIR